MKLIREMFDFDNIGGKIKGLTKWLCWITILLIWCSTPVTFIVLVTDELASAYCWIPLVAAVVAPYAVWIGSWPLYALGEFVEDIHAMRGKDGKSNKKPKKETKKTEGKDPDSFFGTRDFVDIKCPHCNGALSVLAGETDVFCPHCDTGFSRSGGVHAANKTQNAAQLDLRDVEYAVSTYVGRKVSVSEIDCTLIYVIPASMGKPKEMHLSMAVGSEEFSSLELIFFDHQRKAYYYKDKRLALDEPWLPANELFNFDVSLFKSFNTEEDTSD